MTEQTTEIMLVGGQRYRVSGEVKEVEQQILNAARGSLMQLAWLTDVQTGEPLAVNPEHVMTIRAAGSTGQSAESSGTDWAN